ncbi:ROK family protein [bacterium]|nr:ROK family protein [bacterium]
MKKNILAIDLGGTKIAVGLVNFKGKVIKKNVESTEIKKGAQGVIKQILRMGDDLLAGFQEKVVAIGIGTAGPLDIKRGLIFFAPNLPGWHNVQIVKPLKNHFHLPVYFDNDANAAALGEFLFGAGKGTKNMIYLTISTGIGGGIIINKKLYHGRGNAGEIGHMIIDPNGPKCRCGNYGCLEAFSSGTAIAREAKKNLKKASLIWKLAKGKKKNIDARLVFEAYKNGDKLAQKIILKSLVALGIGLVNITHIFNPDKVILGGGVMKDKKYILPFLRDFVRKKVMFGFKKDIKIEATKLKSDVGLIGAASLAIVKIRE